MLKQLVNECVITLQIEPVGPILIKSGIETVTGPDMAFVRVWRNGDEEIYLPGSIFGTVTLDMLSDYQGSLYSFFENQFGVRMIRAEERIRATARDRAFNLVPGFQAVPIVVEFPASGRGVVECRMSVVTG